MRVHLVARQGREVYVEVFQFPNLTPGAEYARHRADLEQRFGPGAVGDLQASSLGTLAGWSYAFHWETGERAVMLLPIDGDTYRLISDPRAPLNNQILATVALVE